MAETAHIVRIGEGKRGDPYRYIGCDVVRAHPDASTGPRRFVLELKPWLPYWEFMPDD